MKWTTTTWDQERERQIRKHLERIGIVGMTPAESKPNPCALVPPAEPEMGQVIDFCAIRRQRQLRRHIPTSSTHGDVA